MMALVACNYLKVYAYWNWNKRRDIGAIVCRLDGSLRIVDRNSIFQILAFKSNVFRLFGASKMGKYWNIVGMFRSAPAFSSHEAIQLMIKSHKSTILLPYIEYKFFSTNLKSEWIPFHNSSVYSKWTLGR